jgi:hypothetical protein
MSQNVSRQAGCALQGFKIKIPNLNYLLSFSFTLISASMLLRYDCYDSVIVAHGHGHGHGISPIKAPMNARSQRL